VELKIIHTTHITLTKSPPNTTINN
jgi:hypothetical protein